MNFLVELHDIMENASCPVYTGGDFNLVRVVNDKNKGNINNRTTFLINKWGLMEIYVSNLSFTWENNQDTLFFLLLIEFFCFVE